METRTPSWGSMGEKMSSRQRSAAPKSRRDKSRPRTVANARAKVVAKRLSEAEWSSLLEAERGDRVIGAILAELLERVMVGCSRANAARQVVPFVVARARDAILHVIQWRFLERDEGDWDPEEGDGSWREDEEPQPLAMDSWAQGTVPILHVPCCPDEGEVSDAHTQDPSTVTEAGSVPASPLWPVQVPTASAILPMPGSPCPELLLPDEGPITPCPTKRTPRHAQPPWLCPARPPAPCPSQGQPEQGWHPLHSSSKEVESSSMAWISRHVPRLPPPSCSSLAAIRPQARPGRSGTITGVPRLGLHRLPERWVKPQVEVLDPEPKKLTRAQGACRQSQAPRLGSSPQVTTVGMWMQGPPAGCAQSPSPLPLPLSSLLSSAQLAPGVTIRQGGSVKQGVKEEEEEEETKRDLRPICPTIRFPGTVNWQVMANSKS